MQGYFIYNEYNNYNKYVILSKEKKIITPIISKNACSTLAKLVLLNNNINISLDKYSALNDYYWKQLHKHTISINNLNDEYKIVSVIRDPIDRIISAYNTIGRNISVNDYLNKVIYTFNNYYDYNINRHIASQFIQYDINKTNLFIPINKLDDYLKTIDITIDRINCSKSEITIDRNKLLPYMYKDYILYNHIINSDKCYNNI